MKKLLLTMLFLMNCALYADESVTLLLTDLMKIEEIQTVASSPTGTFAYVHQDVIDALEAVFGGYTQDELKERSETIYELKVWLNAGFHIAAIEPLLTAIEAVCDYCAQPGADTLSNASEIFGLFKEELKSGDAAIQFDTETHKISLKLWNTDLKQAVLAKSADVPVEEVVTE